MSSEAALSPRRATYFLLLRQKKVGKEKATRSLGPCASLRAPCGARAKRGLARTRLRLRQSRSLFRLTLRSSAQPGRGGVRIQNRIQGALSPLRGLNGARFLVAASARITWASSLKHSKMLFNPAIRFQRTVSNNSRVKLESTFHPSSNCIGFRRGAIAVQTCSTFSPSPTHLLLSAEFNTRSRAQHSL
jgi:hypothetical protein